MPRAGAVIIPSGNGNGDSASLVAAGGPGGAGQPGFNNVGSIGPNGPSVTYLGNGWLLTAGHATLNSSVPIQLNGGNYTVDDGSAVFLVNPDSSLADLKLVRLTTDPGLPAITSDLISSTTPSGRQIMIGNGLQRGDAAYWQVDKSTNPWQWTEQSPPATPGANDYAGFKTVANHSIRWGENEVHDTGLFEFIYTDGGGDPHFVHGYTTQFDDETYTGAAPLAQEGQLSNGDSGGAVFTLDNGQWKLGGIMVAFADLYSGQPPFVSPYYPHTVYGNQALIVDLSVYRDQIVAIVPEPSGWALAALGALAFVGRRRRRR